MAEHFLQMSAGDRRDALLVAAGASGRPVYLLEKDVWVVWTLAVLYGSDLRENLIFKGGTSLSKAFRVINRFSEDVDLTYDIRCIAPELVKGREDALPKSKSEARRWSDHVRETLPRWVQDTVQPLIRDALLSERLDAKVQVEGEKLFLEYSALASHDAYVAPHVMLEFGARSTGEPARQHSIRCDAASHVSSLSFPEAEPKVMDAERTFWEKATAIHVFCHQKRRRGDRFSRHWYDIARLDHAGIVDSAIAKPELAHAVADHKTWFFAEKDENKNPIDYRRAVCGELQLVPEAQARVALRDDYESMRDGGLLHDDAESFDSLMDRCGEIQDKVNRGSR